MSDISLPNDMIANVPLIFKDAAGTVVKAVGGSVTSSNPAVATAAVVVSASGDDTIDVTSVADGLAVTISYTNPEPTLAALPPLAFTVDVVDPPATADSVDFKNVVLRPK